MTAKEYLTRVRQQEKLIQVVGQNVKEITADILSIKSSYSASEHVSSSNQSDIADKYIKLEKYQEREAKEWDKLITMRLQALAMIDAMPNGTHSAVLRLRYIKYKNWDFIVKELNYSWQGIFKVHGAALQEFERIYKDELMKM